ncbi:MAG: hypothetical protein Q9169_005835 [Polycauliona sp. 2 TL-2023]
MEPQSTSVTPEFSSLLEQLLPLTLSCFDISIHIPQIACNNEREQEHTPPYPYLPLAAAVKPRTLGRDQLVPKTPRLCPATNDPPAASYQCKDYNSRSEGILSSALIWAPDNTFADFQAPAVVPMLTVHLS